MATPTEQAPTRQLRFTVPAQNNLPAFSSALTMTETDYQASTAASRRTLEQAQYDAWVAVMTATPPPPTEAVLRGQIDDLRTGMQTTLDQIHQTIAQLTTQDQTTAITRLVTLLNTEIAFLQAHLP